MLKNICKGRGLLDAAAHAPLTVFVWIWAWAGFYQAFYEAPHASLPPLLYIYYLAQLKPFGFLAFLLSIVLILRPRLYDLFLLMLAAVAVQDWLMFPVNSNHMLMEFVFCLAGCLIFAGNWLSFRAAGGEGWRDAYARLAPAGRWLLVIMYFYGVFHKINTDFLNPASSCAATLWKQVPFLPDALAENVFLQYVCIYATFIIETVCIILLMGPARRRSWGILTGIFFHGFLGINLYTFYGAFSLLSIALHSLFLPVSTARRLAALPRRLFRKRRGLKVSLMAGFLLAGPLLLSFQTDSFNLLRAVEGLLCVLIGWGILRARRGAYVTADAPTGLTLLRPRGVVAAAVAILFFVNGGLIYFGGKTGQAVAMFSNLRTEQGSTNHLLMPDKWLKLLPFQDDMVRIVEAKKSPFLEDVARRKSYMNAYTLRATLQRYPDASVTYIDANGKKVRIKRAGDSKEWMAPDPVLVRKFMVFRTATDERPVPCERN